MATKWRCKMIIKRIREYKARGCGTSNLLRVEINTGFNLRAEIHFLTTVVEEFDNPGATNEQKKKTKNHRDSPNLTLLDTIGWRLRHAKYGTS